MAISREEIEEIARAVARRVVPAFKPCRCGLAMWEAHGHTDSLEEVIGAKNRDGLLVSSRQMDAALTGIDEACSVNIARAKGRLNDLAEAGNRGDWEVASRQLIELRVLTREPLAESATPKEGGNPGVSIELWEMTREEYVKSARQWREEYMPRLTGRALETELEQVAAGHKRIVQNAIGLGKSVPPEVLADYPDLMKGGK